MTTTPPKRIKIRQSKSKPILVVVDRKGDPIMSGSHHLAWHSTTARFYVGRTGPREYLKGTDLDLAVLAFHRWIAKRKGQTVTITSDPRPVPQAHKPMLRKLKPQTDWDAYRGVDIHDIPTAAFWASVRHEILRDPANAAKMTGISQLAHLTDLEPIQSVSLSRLVICFTESETFAGLD